MKKSLFLAVSALAVLSFTSCKTSQKNYQAAYEKAIEEEKVVEVKPEEEPKKVVVTAQPESMERVNVERVTVVAGDPSYLKDYGVVIGSFANKTNALGQYDRMKKMGYNQAVVVINENNMYRMVVTSYDTKNEAVSFRNSFKAQYPADKEFQKSWILMKQR